MPKQFKLRFPLFVWSPAREVTLQYWEAMSDGTTDACDLRVIAYKIIHPNGPEYDRVTIFTLRDVRDGVAEYWPKSTDVRFPLVENMKAWDFKLVSEEPIYGACPPGHSYCGVCGQECTTVKALATVTTAGEWVSSCCWGSLWADPSLTIAWGKKEEVPLASD
jgi:hypothetical protein